jgi:hypothetical protein
MTMQVPEGSSALRNILVQVVTDPCMPWEGVAMAAELIAMDVRFDDWFLRVGKTSLPSEYLEQCLEMSDGITASVEAAWNKRQEEGGVSLLCEALGRSLAKLEDAMRRSSEAPTS